MNPNALPLDLQAQLQSLLAQNQANSYPPPRSVQPLRQEHQQPQSHQHRQQSHPQPRRHQQHSSHQPQSHDHYQRQQRVSRSGPDPNAHAAWLEHSRINAHTDINTPTASDDHMSGGSSNYEAGSVSGADGSNGSSMARDPGACERGSTKLQVPFFRVSLRLKLHTRDQTTQDGTCHQTLFLACPLTRQNDTTIACGRCEQER